LDSLDTLGKSFKDSSDISTLLHGDDTELIFLVDPDQEGLLVVVEDTTTLGPVTLHTGNGQVSVSRNKEEVVIDKLLADSLIHSGEWVVVSSKVLREVLDCGFHELLNSETLVPGDSGRQTESIDGAADTDSARVYWDILSNVAPDLSNIHVRGVLGSRRDSVVFLNKGVEDGSEVLVGVPVTGVDTAVLVVEFNSASDGLNEGESRGLGLDSLQLLPLVFGNILGNK